MPVTITLDIETCNATSDELAIEEQFLKPHPATKDADKQRTQLADKARQLKEKSALTDACQIACVAMHIQTDDDEKTLVFHRLGIDVDCEIAVAVPSDKEREMLIELRGLLDDIALSGDVDTMSIVGVNICRFDIPKLRFRYVLNRLRLPLLLEPTSAVKVIDLMKYYCRYMTIKYTDFVSLDEMALRLGIVSEGKPISSAEIPRMIDEGLGSEVISHCALDVIKTHEIYRVLFGVDAE